MYAVVGLGNPSKECIDTFHNAGFLAVDCIASGFNISFLKSANLKSECVTIEITGHKVILSKPNTYMNLSGIAVARIVNFYKIDINNLIIIRDDIDMELGKLKIKSESKSGGHKGVQSIIDAIGSNKFIQVKMGVGKADNAANHVLRKLSKEESQILQALAIVAAKASVDIIAHGTEWAANYYNNFLVKEGQETKFGEKLKD